MDPAAAVNMAVETAERCRANIEEAGMTASARRGMDMSALPEDPTIDEILNVDVNELLERFRNGDQSVLSALRGKDGSAVMLKLQDAINQENRVYTFLSQKLSTEHETMKSIINNIR